MSTTQGKNTSGAPADERTPRPSLLPDWMRDPPPPRLTLGDRVGTMLLRVPGAPRLRQNWWVWRDRQRIYQRHPNAFKIVAFFGSWALALGLLLLAYALLGLLGPDALVGVF